MNIEPFFRFSTQTVFKAPSKLFSKINNQQWTKKKNSGNKLQDISFSDPIPVIVKSKILKPSGDNDTAPAESALPGIKSNSGSSDDSTKEASSTKETSEQSFVSFKESSGDSSQSAQGESNRSSSPSEKLLDSIVRNSLEQPLGDSEVDLWIILNEENDGFPLLSPKASTAATVPFSIPSDSDLPVKQAVTSVVDVEAESVTSSSSDSERDDQIPRATKVSTSSTESDSESVQAFQPEISPANSKLPSPTETNKVDGSRDPKEGRLSSLEPESISNEVIVASPEFQNSVNAFWSLHSNLGPSQQDESVNRTSKSRNFSLEIGRKTRSGKFGFKKRDSGNTFVFDEKLRGESNEVIPAAQKKREKILEKMRFDGSDVNHAFDTDQLATKQNSEEFKLENKPETSKNSKKHVSKLNTLEPTDAIDDNLTSHEDKSFEKRITHTDSSDTEGNQGGDGDTTPALTSARLDSQDTEKKQDETAVQTSTTTSNSGLSIRHIWKDLADGKSVRPIRKRSSEASKISNAVLRPNPLKNTGSINDIAGFKSPTSPRGPGYQPGYISGGMIRTPTTNDQDSYRASTVLRQSQRKSAAPSVAAKKNHGSFQGKIRKSERINRPLPDTPFVKEEGLIANLGGTKHEAIFSHRRQLSDEIDLDPGDILKVFEVFEDGWCLARISGPKNKAERRNQIGACPRCCLRRLD